MRALFTCATTSVLCLMAGTLIRPTPPDAVAPSFRAVHATSSVRAASAAQLTRPQDGKPVRPRETVDTSEPQVGGRRIHVPADGNLQKALDEAKPGDHITLEPGATYKGPFRLRAKPGADWIVVSSAAMDRLPRARERVTPAHATLMPKLRAASQSVITAEPGAHHYRLAGLDIAPSEDSFLYNIVELGADENSVDALPHHIILDRCFIHGDAKAGGRRGVAMNSRHTAVIDSYLSDFKEASADSQAIAGWNGPGPFAIANNYLEAAGENVMFGGADPSIQDLVPSDIEIARNHFSKPLRWKKGHAQFEGKAWAVKNLFELKNARRVLVDGNLFEHNWPDAQNGFAILFTVRNQDGRAPWSVVEDVVFSNNVVRHVAAGFNILGRDDIHQSQQTQRIAIRGNLFVDVGGSWGQGRLFQLLDGTRDVTIDHNTAVQTGSLVFGGDHAPHSGFVFENNVALHNEHGIHGSGTGSGTQTLEKYFPGAVVRRNLIVGGDAARYPRDNFFPATLADAGLLQQPDGSYKQALPRQFAKSASDGRDPGADVTAITSGLDRISSALWTIPTGLPPVVEVLTAQIVGAGAWPLDRELVFWLALLLLAYVYVGYPLLTWIRARLWPLTHVRAPMEPSVTVIVVAHNEADRIEARIDNILELDYPRDRLEIVIGSDGSTDDTARLARQYSEAGVTVRAFRQRRGKTAVLDDLIPRARGEIVVLGDARQKFAPNVVRALVSHFADPQVGAVSGELMLTVDGTGTSAAQGTAFYWRYEKFIRLHESRAASTVGATGSIYAIRKALFEPIPPDTILDDVLIPLRIVRRGYCTLFDPEARAYDKVSATAQQEYVRKLRTIAGTFQLFAREPWLLNPFRNPLWFETISHKGLRLVIPLLHAALLATNIGLAEESRFYQALLTGQIAFYAAALIGHVFRHARWRPIVLTVPYAMCLLTWTTVAGFARFIMHRQQATWEAAYPARIIGMTVASGLSRKPQTRAS